MLPASSTTTGAAVDAAIAFPENGGQDHGGVRVWWDQ